MLTQTISSDFLVDLSPEKQQLLSGGCKSTCGGEKTTCGQTSPIPSQPSARMVVGNIITVTPYTKCLSGSNFR